MSSEMNHLIFVNGSGQDKNFKDQERDAELDEFETPSNGFKMAQSSSSRKRRQKKLSFDSDSDSDKENAVNGYVTTGCI